MSAWAKPGVKCVCINDIWPETAWYGWEFLPRLGATYTVRETLTVDGQAGMRLVEISNPRADYRWGFVEPAFAVVRFQPADDADTTIFNSVEEPA